MEEGSSDQGQKHWDYAVRGANGEKTTEEHRVQTQVKFVYAS